jgi:hypothetical protein
MREETVDPRPRVPGVERALAGLEEDRGAQRRSDVLRAAHSRVRSARDRSTVFASRPARTPAEGP